MAGIEANISPKFQRPGIYPKLQAEHYGTFWVALLATVCMLAAGAVLIRSPRKATNPRRPAWAYLLFLILLIPAVIFCGWYYGSEFHRLSPELAGSGRVAIWIDWLVGAILAVILVTAGACRLSSSGRSTTISTDLTPDIHGRAFHESFVCLLLLAVYATATLGLMLFELVPPSYWNSRIPFWYQVLSPFVFPESLLVVVVPFIIAFQLICLSWQDRRQAVAWTLTGVSRTEFLVNWIALAMLLTVAVPTLNAFSFVFWLGPFKYLDI